MLNANTIIKKLNLAPLPEEGGYYGETFRSNRYIPKDILPEGNKGDRLFYTTIYYLLTPKDFSAIHRLPGDEIFHFYLGDTVEMHIFSPSGEYEKKLLGNDIENDIFPQQIVPGNAWQGCRLQEDGRFALLGTTMSPGFDFEDHEMATQAELNRIYPEQVPSISLFF